MAYGQRDKRIVLHRVWLGKGTSTLAAALSAEFTTRSAVTAGGRFITGVSGNASSVSYATPSANGVNTNDAASIAMDLIDLYNLVYAALGGSPNDTAIYTEMMFRLDTPVADVENDFTSLRA